MTRYLLWMFASLMVMSAPAWAQDPADPDEEGCKDSTLLTRMAGCQLYECSTKEFDAVEIIAGKYDPQSGETPMKALEGAIDFRHYVCPAKLSQLQIARNMEAAFKKAGFTIVTSGKGENEYQIVVARKGPQWVEIKTEFFNEYPTYKQTEVVEQGMEQQVEADASALADAITKTGSVAVYGITFETGKATLEPASEAVLGEIVTLLNEHTDWRFEVQGHTDNVGGKAANMALSEQRAKAVVAWLTSQGIDGARLVAKGYGDSEPVADNTTDEGRAKNRRVELKKINVE